jgi:hypothetical protein
MPRIEAMSRLDRLALRQGASVTFVFAIPPTLIARFVIDTYDSPGAWAPFLSLIALFGFILGSGVAAWRTTTGQPMAHAFLAGAGVFVAAQVAFLLIRLAAGGDIRVGRILVTFSLSLVASFVGGWLGIGLRKSGATPSR